MGGVLAHKADVERTRGWMREGETNMKYHITSSNGRAISFHLRKGLDNGDIGREALAVWINGICDEYDGLKFDLDEMNVWMKLRQEMIDTRAAERDAVLEALKVLHRGILGSGYATRTAMSEAANAIERFEKEKS